MADNLKIKRSIANDLGPTYDPVEDLPVEVQRKINNTNYDQRQQVLESELEKQPVMDKLQRLLKTAYYGRTR
jgi:hypothetical protein